MSTEATPEATTASVAPAFKPGDKVLVTAEVVASNGPNWILKLSNRTHSIFAPEEITKP